MKKILMLLVLVILLTGCSANVNLTVTSNNIEEEIIISAYSDSVTSKAKIYTSFRKYMPVFVNVPLSDTEPDTKKDGVEYYTRSDQDLGSGYRFNYKYKYKFDDYKNARSVKLGFTSRTIQRNSVDKNIMISTDSAGLKFFEQYPSLENVTINIKSSYKMLDNNADYINGNVYTWVLRKGVKKSIYLLLDDPNAGQTNNQEPGGGTIEKEPIIVVEEKEESEFIKFVNDNSILVAIIGILTFFIILLIISKLSKFKY